MKIPGANLVLEFKVSYKKPQSTQLNIEFAENYTPDIRAVSVGDSSAVSKPGIKLAQSFVNAKGIVSSGYGKPKVEVDTPKISPQGIAWNGDVPSPMYVRWRRYISPEAIIPPETPIMVSRVKSLGGYQAPHAGGLNLNWRGEAYTPPSTASLNLEFGRIGYSSLILSLGDQSRYGVATITQSLAIKPVGFVAQLFGNPGLTTTKMTIYPLLGNQSIFGNPHLSNRAAPLQVKGFDALQVGTVRVELFRRYIRLGSSQSIGPIEPPLPFVQGGKRFLTAQGFNSFLSGVLKITREREVQYANLSGKGISAPLLDQPIVTPRILYPGPFVATLWGMPKVQRNPSPIGFVNTRYGSAWVTLGQRFLLPSSFNAFAEGYPKVFDPTQRIIQQLTKIPGGIFGDILVRNKNHYVNVEGNLQSQFSDWGNVESNLRYIVGRTDNTFTVFGETAIRNKTPSIAPKGMTGVIGHANISFYKRTIYVPGFAQYAVGRPAIKKTPQLDAKSFDAQLFGNTFISNYYRGLDVKGFNDSKFGSTMVWHRVRYIDGIKDLGVADTGKPTLTLGLREMLIKGSEHSAYGKPGLTFRVRTLEPVSVTEIFKSNHTVGGTQWLIAKGFSATGFGERIIPVGQTLYAQGFAGIVSIPLVKNYITYLHPFGFNSDNIPIHGRWGSNKVFNLRQYVTMFYDVDSELNPPKDHSKWLSVANRNRTMQIYGATATLYGRPAVSNKAVAMLPTAIDSTFIGKQRISHSTQIVKPESLEAPYISGWSNISNDAKVLAAKPFNSAVFGTAAVENTRKFYKVQGYENQIFGYPMVAFRIRELTFESRYGIAPVRIELPHVQLWIRYIEPVSIFKEAFGGIELFRYQGRLTTRWAHKELAGQPAIRNVTPELKVWSMLGEDFGKPTIQLLRRFIAKDGFVATVIPKHRIEFKTRNLQMQSIPALNISQKHKLERTGSQPYAKQWVSLEHPDASYFNDVSTSIGYGIPIPGENHYGSSTQAPDQVSKPTMNQMVIRHDSTFNSGDMARIGKPMISANTVRILSGIGSFDAGEAMVSLKHRRIIVDEFPDSEVFEPSPAALSPWTIYAVVEAPAQAIRNHLASGQNHLVRSESVVGIPTLTLRHRKITQSNTSSQSRFGTTMIELYRRFIKVDGFNTFRFGFHSVPEWLRTVEQHTSMDTSLYGLANVGRPKELVQLTIKPKGIESPIFERPLIQFFHRAFRMTGFNAAIFGNSVNDDKEYYPQRLHVGFKKPVMPVGTDCAKYGKASVTYRHRQVGAKGFESFISTYTIEKFKDRLKVTLVNKPPMISNQVVNVVAIESQNYGTPDIKLAVHYIRPDGNTDQFRKGVPQ